MSLFNQNVFQIPRGTRDFTPKEMNKRQFVEENIRNTFQKYGYREIQTPVFENLDLFTAKSGEGIINELYSFTDKGGRNLALRPELTAPVIRCYVDKLQMEPKPLKLFYFGNCYRYDRPQKGRYREFKQAGCEIIGTDTPEAIAELIALSYNILKDIGLKNIKLNIGNLNLLSNIFKKLDITKEQKEYIIPLIDKELFEDVLKALQEFKISPKDASEFVDIIQSNDLKTVSNYIDLDDESKEEIKKLEKILKLLKEQFKITNFEIKMSIVRGLDYYKGIVFEIEAPALGAEKQLCGGGSYELISMFKGRDTSTAGFAIGFDRSILALETENFKFADLALDVYVIAVNEETIDKAIEIAENLRKENLTVDVDLLRRGIGKSLKYASSINAKKSIIIGPDELAENSVTIRDMNTGNQDKVKISELIAKLS